MNYINGLHFNNIRGDFYGGLTAAVVALPLATAMGVASGVGPIAGTLFYLLFLPAGSTTIIGDIPTGFPELHAPTLDIDILLKMVASALTLAGLGAIDSLLTSRSKTCTP